MDKLLLQSTNIKRLCAVLHVVLVMAGMVCFSRYCHPGCDVTPSIWFLGVGVGDGMLGLRC